MSAVLAWVLPDPARVAVAPYRACELCSYSVVPHMPHAQLCCCCPVVTGPDLPSTVDLARARDGGCGPDARHLRWPLIGALG